MTTPSPALQIRTLSKSFALREGALEVLRDITLTVEAGEFVTIVGASGCGKSTLLRLILGLDRDFRGEIRVDGVPVTGPAADRAIVFQDHRLLPWLTAEANVAAALLNSPLDAETRLRMQEELKRIVAHEGATALLVTHDVDEAVYLGHRVVMQPHPGRIATIQQVAPEARADRSSPAFVALRDRILALLGVGAAETLAV